MQSPEHYRQHAWHIDEYFCLKCQPNVGAMSAKRWRNVSQMLAQCQPNVGAMSAKCWRNVSQMMAQCQPNGNAMSARVLPLGIKGASSSLQYVAVIYRFFAYPTET